MTVKNLPVPVLKVDHVLNHPNADRLSLVTVGSHTMVWGKTDDGEHAFKPGDIVVYIPVGATIPEWLLRRMGYWNEEEGRGTLRGKNHDEVRMVKLRGVTSGGLILPITVVDQSKLVVTNEGGETLEVTLGDDVAAFLGITPPTTWQPDRPRRSAVELKLSGWIVTGSDGDHSNALYLIDHRTGRFDAPLAKTVYDRSGYGKRPVTVNYHITDEPVSEMELHERLVAMMCGTTHEGEGDLSYYHRYSDMTGYLWTDEKFRVGGHNVIAELTTYRGKWCFMTVTIHGDR